MWGLMPFQRVPLFLQFLEEATSSATGRPTGCSSMGGRSGISATASAQPRRACPRRRASARPSPTKWAGTALSSWTWCGPPTARPPSVPSPRWTRSDRSGGNNIIAVPLQGAKRSGGAARRSNRLRRCGFPRPTISRPATARSGTRKGWAGLGHMTVMGPSPYAAHLLAT
jgi:hypothetical protein